MTFSTTSAATRPRRTRTLIAGLAVATASAATFAMPGTAAASPAAVVAPQGKGRSADAIAGQATYALSLWRQYERDADPERYEAFTSQRDAVAWSVANRLLVEPEDMQRAWAAADAQHQEALLAGLTQLGVPYRRNSSKPGEGFDCSGLTTYAWGEAGITLSRQSSAQIRDAAPRTFDTAQAGDLVQYPGHVMMWLGVGHSILHSPYSGRTVEVDTIDRKNLKVGDPTE